MKFFYVILLLSVSLISFVPSFLQLKSFINTQITSKDDCCKMGNCSAETNENDNSSPCTSGMCNSSQCIFACFLCPINNTNLQIHLFESIADHNRVIGQYNLSEFAGEYWQPPKFLMS